MTKGASKTSLKFGCLNSRSICNKVAAVIELIHDNMVDVCFLTESWLKIKDKAIYAEIREYGYDILSQPRKGRGGGVAFIFNPKTVNLKKNRVNSFKSFEVLETILKNQDGLTRLSVIYRISESHQLCKFWLN